MNQDEEMDAWLCEVEMANEYIKNLNDPKKAAEQEAKFQRREVEKKREAELKKQKLEEQERKLIEGHPGKGGTDKYASFCRHCFWEYERETPQCLRCKNVTETQETRRKQLMKKVDEYKQKKLKKEEHKKKAELLKKTNAMQWNKHSTNYKKWEQITSSDEEEENKEPILPKNDPGFQMLEKDLSDRNKKKAADRKQAIGKKEEGNLYMEQKNYEKAVEMQSDGLEICKDYLPLFTNRALAQIKLKKYLKAIKDCTSMLEYCEVFENGQTKSRDLCMKVIENSNYFIKALLRRGLAQRERAELENAKKDIEEVLKLDKNCNEAKSLLNEIEFLLEHEKARTETIILAKKTEKEAKSQEPADILNEKAPAKLDPEKDEKEKSIEKIAKQPDEKLEKAQEATKEIELDPIFKGAMQKIDGFLAKGSITSNDCTEMEELFVQNVKSKIYFIEKQGISKILEKSNVDFSLNLINTLIAGNVAFIDSFSKQKGIEILIEKAAENASFPKTLNKIFNILLTLTLVEKQRNLLKEKKEIENLIFNFFKEQITKFENSADFLAILISFLSNLCVGKSAFSNIILAKIDFLFEKFMPVFTTQIHTKEMESLQENIANFLMNLANERAAFERIVENHKLLLVLAQKLEKQWFFESLLESILGLFVNLVTQSENSSSFSSINLLEIVKKYIFFDKNQKKYTEIIHRALKILSKLQHATENIDEKYVFQIADQFKTDFKPAAVRLMLKIIMEEHGKTFFRAIKQEDIVKEMIESLKRIIESSENEPLFCNTCSLIGEFVEIWDDSKSLFFQNIEPLLYFVKDGTGNKRKNSAILLAKLAKNQRNLEKLRDIHGIEILKSVTPHVLQK